MTGYNDNMSKYDVTGRRWTVGSIAYIIDDHTLDFSQCELKVRILKENISPKYGRGQEWGYYYEILDSTKNFPHHGDKEYYMGSHWKPGTKFHKNPKLKW